MNPLKYFMEEVYRDYWGIPVNRDERTRRAEQPLVWPITRTQPRQRRY